MLAIREIYSQEQFQALKPGWDNLLAESRAQSFFLTWEWAFCWWEHCRDKTHRLFILVVTETSNPPHTPLAIAPFFITHKKKGFFAVKEIRFLGTHIVNGEYLDFILASTCDRHQVLNVIFEYLEKNVDRWDILRLTDMPKDSKNLKCVEELAITKTFRYIQNDRIICPFIPLNETWERLSLSFNKRVLKNFKYQKRRLAKEFDVDLALYDHRHLSSEVENFLKLHEQRWSSKGLAGAFVDPRKVKFYMAIAALSHKNQRLRLWFFKINGRPVAALWGFRYGKTFYYLQSGFDPEWSKYSVGQILLGGVIKEAASEGCETFDFLRGNEPYKYDWGAVDKETVSVDISCRTFRTGFIYILIFIKKMLGVF